MVYKITGEQPFQVLSDSFSISPSEQDYVVQVSADGVNYSDLFAVSAGQTKMCTGMSNGSYFRLKNNQSEVSVNWRTTCKGGESGGGGGGTGPQGPQGATGAQGPQGADGAQGPQGPAGAGDPEAIQEAIDANNTLIEEGEIIAGMAKQLYSPDGVTSEGAFAYRTTAGDEDVSTGPAKLQKIEGNATFPETEYNDSVVLMRGSEEVTGFTCDIEWGANIPNDIPVGESTYTYGLDSWSPELPLAISNMQIDGEPYGGETDDELIITRSAYKEGSATYPAPDSFVALGLNSFTKDGSPINLMATENTRIGDVSIDEDDYGLYQDNDYDIYAVKAVTGLENGYIVYHKEGSSVSVAGVADKDIENLDICYSATVHTSTYDVVYPTDDYPYIVFSLRKDDEGTVCVHPRWSGYMDENYEDYAESVLDISSFNEDCPLLSVGNVRNIWDFENSQLIQNIGVSTYSAQAVQDLIDGGKEIGVDFDFDEDYIYEVLDEPIVTDITFENEYDANDFSVEYFAQDNGLISTPVYATTWYMNNLVDKLRRMEMYFVHLDNLSSEGEVGKTYEYQGRIMRWVEGSGYTAEWLKNIGQLSERNEGTGLIYAVIPNNTKLFEYKYPYGGEWRYVVYNDGKLYCTETGGTVVASASTGEEFNFPATQNGNIYQVRGIFKNGYIGFYKNGYISCQNVWNGSTNVGHFELMDKDNYPYIYNPSESYIYGVNEKGQAVSKKQSFGTKTVYFNNTGYSNSMGYITNGSNNGPDRMWVPTTGGEAGQTLVSAGGNSAPVWETRIKAQKITSADYEALVQAGTTDPNTLYLLDDN